jgi:hypothetical protein
MHNEDDLSLKTVHILTKAPLHNEFTLDVIVQTGHNHSTIAQSTYLYGQQTRAAVAASAGTPVDVDNQTSAKRVKKQQLTENGTAAALLLNGTRKKVIP